MNFTLRVESPDQKVIVYLPENEGTLIKEIYLMAIEALRCISYYRQLLIDHPRFDHALKLECSGHTIHAYYHLIITHWCRIFGSERKQSKSKRGEPSHYLELIKIPNMSIALEKIGIVPCNQSKLKNILLKRSNIVEADFDNFRDSTVKRYRNKYMVHKEYVNDKTLIENLFHPDIHFIPYKTFLALSFILQEAVMHLTKTKKTADGMELEFYTIQDENEFKRLVLTSPPFNC